MFSTCLNLFLYSSHPNFKVPSPFRKMNQHSLFMSIHVYSCLLCFDVQERRSNGGHNGHRPCLGILTGPTSTTRSMALMVVSKQRAAARRQQNRPPWSTVVHQLLHYAKVVPPVVPEMHRMKAPFGSFPIC